jgi:hypothetical protein
MRLASGVIFFRRRGNKIVPANIIDTARGASPAAHGTGQQGIDNVNLFYELLADFLVTIHLAYMAYVVFGQLAILIGWPLRWRWIRNPWFRLSHLAMILIVATEAVADYECPLTTWERDLRIHIGQIPAVRGPDWEVENASFVAWLMRTIMFPDNRFVPYLKPGYYTFAGLVLTTALLAPPRFRRRVTPPVNQPAYPEAPTEVEPVTELMPPDGKTK